MSFDVFRPRSQPAQAIYDALLAETKKRRIRSVNEWIQAERLAVWNAANDAALQVGATPPTMAQVMVAERSSMGHTDYCLKWALRVAENIVVPTA